MRLTPQQVAATISLAVVVLTIAAFLAIGTGGGHFPGHRDHPTASVTATGSQDRSLPAGCEKPPGGYLIIANEEGFNDSIAHGAPTITWPVVTVKVGSTVHIEVCNADRQAHGFQVTHYFDSNIETVSLGQVINVSFVADRPGTFEIYCSIFCSIHIYMQNEELRVLSQ